MRFMRTKPSWSNLWYSVFTIAHVFCLVTMQVPPPAYAFPEGSQYDASDSCYACEIDTCVPQTPSDLPCRERAESNENVAGQEIPDSQPCCPNGCTHCHLPCCGTVFFVQDPLLLTAASQPVHYLAAFQSRLPSLVDPSDIFHPPRN